MAVHFPIVWQESDDISMKRMASGYFTGEPDLHLIFINACLGWIFKLFYSIKPSTQWYSWFFLVGMAWVNSIIAFLFFRKSNRITALTLTLFLLVWCLYLLKFNIAYQFTILSSLFGFSGFLLLHFSFKEKQPSLFWSIAAGLSVLLSFLLRKESFFLVSLFMLPIMGFFIKERWKQYLTRLVPVFLGIIICFGFDVYVYSSPDWQDYLAYNKIRPIIPDGAVNDLTGLESGIKSAGWDTLDFRFRQQYMHECVPKFTNEKIEIVNGALQNKATSSWVAFGFEQYIGRIIFLFMFLALAAVSVRSQDSILLLVAFSITIAAIYFVAIHIRIPERVLAPVFFMSATYGILLLKEKFEQQLDRIPEFLCTLFSLFLIYQVLDQLMEHHRVETFKLELGQSHRDEFVDSLESPILPGIIQITPMAREVFNDYLVFEKDQTSKFLKVMPNGWLHHSPIMIGVARHFGLKEYCKLQVSAFSPQVFQVDFQNNFLLKKYINKNYPEMRIDTLFVSSTGDYCAYKLERKKL